MRCPNCGKGHLFGNYLKVADQCEECGEEFHRHRADDLPAYLVIIVVGHVIVPAVLAVEVAYSSPYWLHALRERPLCAEAAIQRTNLGLFGFSHPPLKLDGSR
ncbi:DUF983 domain-containing protein [Leptospira interrogans]